MKITIHRLERQKFEHFANHNGLDLEIAEVADCHFTARFLGLKLAMFEKVLGSGETPEAAVESLAKNLYGIGFFNQRGHYDTIPLLYVGDIDIP